ncbi:TRAFAC clade GTPase domain-containing protein [Burkholderia gladioli]|uniref:TRAFAC clade GTPase domain-containing protein n=1 Tax=Burkholderia gladioli TaxID=28095 RepID=UPI00265041B7|nr:hypothetical protein [Burkholderia gladioli]MDN7752664.1 hypothetical protein [Burkholderia gladioli]
MTRKLVIAGMPESGKSTFLIALRHLLIFHEVQTALIATRLSDFEKHMNELEEKWIACEPVKRTKQAVEEWVSLHVRRREDSTEAEIMVPDFSGEAFRRPAATGNCSSAIAQMLSELDGLLLFTNADRSADDVRLEPLAALLSDNATSTVDEAIVDATAVPDRRAENGRTERAEPQTMAQQGGPDNGQVAADQADPYNPIPFDPMNMPEEALLVELLQILNRRPRPPKERAIAVIVSAWDVVETAALSPEQWLEQNRPMLWQYLLNNDDQWKLRVYGVSAQGGKLPEEKTALQAKTPGQRVQVIGHDAQPHDLTAPIDWLMAEIASEEHA